jgi:hypothetical protein
MYHHPTDKGEDKAGGECKCFISEACMVVAMVILFLYLQVNENLPDTFCLEIG